MSGPERARHLAKRWHQEVAKGRPHRRGGLWVRSGGLDAVEHPRWPVFCVRFVHEQLSWQTPDALSPDPEDLP